MSAALRVERLCVRAGETVIVEDLSLSLGFGQILILLGETGSGKSLLAQAILGALPEGVTGQGRIEVEGRTVSELSAADRQLLWGRHIVMLPQEPWRALDPLMRSEQQVSEVYEDVGHLDAASARTAAASDLRRVKLLDAGSKRAHELSGGMAQRVAFCAATAGGAEILIADEPTKGLDASRRSEITVLLLEKARQGAVLVITHDIEVALQLSAHPMAHLMVMREGRLVEEGPAAERLQQPASAYARELIAADPEHWPRRAREAPASTPGAAEPVLRVTRLCKRRGGRQLFRDLSFDVHPGQVIGVTGESGCGKSTLGDVMLGLLPPDDGRVARIASAASHRFLKLYQDPPAAFADEVTLRVLLEDLIRLHRLDVRRLAELMKEVGLSMDLLDRTARNVSGGELQRIALARALLLEPVLLFADEPTSRLDPITARQILLLIVRLAREHRCGLLLVSHDPRVIERVCDSTIALGTVPVQPSADARRRTA